MPQKIYGLNSSVDDLVDITEVGSNLAKSADAAAARTTISAASSTHTHTQSEVDGLTTSLNGKASVTHQHNAADTVAGEFDPARIPTLPQSKVTNLSADLNTKITNSSGTTMRVRGYGVSLPSEGNQTGDIWFLQG